MKPASVVLGWGCVLWTWSQGAPAEETYVAYSGTATALHAQRFLYGESHVLSYQDGKLAAREVLYTCRDGSPFARKTVSYVDPLAPDFALEDATNGMRSGVRGTGSQRSVYFQAGSGDREKQAPLPQVTGLVVDAGFDEFVRNHWQPLLTGESLAMPFLLPSRAEEKTFSVQHVRGDRLDGRPVELFRLKLTGLLGMVVPSIDVYYDSHDHSLVRYDGVSDLRDASNNNYDARIDFPAADRKSSDADALRHARQVALAPCK